MARATIFKVQLPVTSNVQDRVPMALIYNQDRSVSIMLPVDRNISNFMNGAYKKFFLGIIDRERIEIFNEESWQDW